MNVSLPVVAFLNGSAAAVRAAANQAINDTDHTSELERLREENAQLKLWKWRAKELERKLSHVSDLANLVQEKKLAFITARVSTFSRGPFGTRAIINAGSERGITLGDAVVDRAGLVGVVADVHRSTATLRLIEDQHSRIDVLIGEDKKKAVAVGALEGGLVIKKTTDELFDIVSGDELTVDGQTGTLPHGVRVGKIYKLDTDDFRITPYANLNSLEYVSVFLSDPNAYRRLTRAGER